MTIGHRQAGPAAAGRERKTTEPSSPPTVSGRRCNPTRSPACLPDHLAPIHVDSRRDAQPLTRDQAAELLGIHPRTLDRWARLDRIRVIDLGGTVRIRVDEVQRLLPNRDSRSA